MVRQYCFANVKLAGLGAMCIGDTVQVLKFELSDSGDFVEFSWINDIYQVVLLNWA